MKMIPLSAVREAVLDEISDRRPEPTNRPSLGGIRRVRGYVAGQRSDTVMIVHISPGRHLVTVVNLRDDVPTVQMLMDGRVDAVMAYYHHTVVARAAGRDFEAVVTLGVTPGIKVLVANHARDKYKTPKDAVKALAEISSETVKKKTFVLAADIAMSSGEVDAAEEEMLEAMQRVLGIDDNLANAIVQVLALKYQS